MPDDTIQIDSSSKDYPARLRDPELSLRYASLSVIADVRLLNRQLLGLLCSTRRLGDAILKTYDLARALRAASVPVIGGFHSPMEKEILDFLLRGNQPIVICPARSIDRMRVPSNWRVGINSQRVVVVSPLTKLNRRATSNLAEERNVFVSDASEEIVVLYADPGGRIDLLSRDLIIKGRTVWTLDVPDNASLIQAGARPSTPEALAQTCRYWYS